MLRLNILVEIYKHFHRCSCIALTYLLKSLYLTSSKFYDFIITHVSNFWIEVCYFTFASTIGFVILKSLRPRTYNPKDLDLFFTSVSATTVSSMSTIEMEVFSNSQLIVITILMFIGGKVFISMVGLYFSASKLTYTPLKARSRVNSVARLPLPFESIELGSISPSSCQEIPSSNITMEKTKSEIDFLIKSKSIRVLGFIVLSYLVIVNVLGIFMVLAYINIISSAKNVIEKKGLNPLFFSIFTVVSTFANCGFIPTNENMQVFSQNSGFLLMLIPQILLGNTLFPSFLRFLIWIVGKFAKKDETKFLMRNTKEIGYHHLLSSKHSKLLIMTVLGFILVQFVLFCAMEWGFEGLDGLNVYQKIVGLLFQCVNTRHTGESIVDLSSISPAILVVVVFMMYLPSYTSFLPIKEEEGEYPQIMPYKLEKERNKILKNLILSQLSYIVIFVIIICITERQNMKDDPLNFSVFNIVFEVVSAYGNVGFSTGYSCGRQLKADPKCVNKWYGFAGSWSDQGKMVLVLVMLFGRLKKFSFRGGKSWKLL